MVSICSTVAPFFLRYEYDGIAKKMFARSVGEVKYGEVIGYQLIYKGKESLSLVYEVVIIVDVVDYVVYECPFSLFKFFIRPPVQETHIMYTSAVF